MRKLFLILATLFVAHAVTLAQENSNLIVLDTYLHGGQRAISTKEFHLSDTTVNDKRISAYYSVNRVKNGKDIQYGLVLKLKSMNKLYVKEGQPVVFRLMAHTLTKRTVDDIDWNEDMQYRTGWYDNAITLVMDYTQMKLLSTGYVKIIRIKTDLGQLIDLLIPQNNFSDGIKICLKAISNQLDKDKHLYDGL